MSKTRKTRCWSCQSLDVIRWGKQLGKQRFKCKNCGLLFTRSNPWVSNQNRFIWFRDWIVGKQTYEQISSASGYSIRTLERYFESYLSQYPPWKVRSSERANLLIDGTYFANKVCLVLYRNHSIKSTLMYRLTDGEWLDEMQEDLQNLISIGICIESVTCDGLSNIIKAVRAVDSRIITQRCVIHIQRETLTWLSRNPQSPAGQELRYIIQRIHFIEDRHYWAYWVAELQQWHDTYHEFINHKSYKSETNRYWYTHKSVRKAFIHIKRALPNMFHYLDNENIPKSTNGLESFFGHLKQNISIHRGLSKEHYKNYIKWYLYFKSNEEVFKP